MSKVAVQGNALGTGTFTIAAPNSNANPTMTLPEIGGVVATTGPAFTAVLSAGQTVAHNTPSKLAFATEVTDTDGCYDPVLYRWTPNVAGLFKITLSAQLDGGGIGANTLGLVYIYKNGVSYRAASIRWTGSGDEMVAVTAMVPMNGSSDYLEAYFYQAGGASEVVNNGNATFFEGHFVRPL